MKILKRAFGECVFFDTSLQFCYAFIAVLIRLQDGDYSFQNLCKYENQPYEI